jgi:hypothetical protein
MPSIALKEPYQIISFLEKINIKEIKFIGL